MCMVGVYVSMYVYFRLVLHVFVDVWCKYIYVYDFVCAYIEKTVVVGLGLGLGLSMCACVCVCVCV